MNPTESFLVLLLAGLATAIALGAVVVPPALLHSSVSQSFLLVMTLVLFAYSPVVGIASIALFAILMFKRNVQKTTQYSHVAQQVAQEFARESVAQQKYQATPYAAVGVTAPRNYVQVRDTVPMSISLEGYASPEEIGTYPLGPRPSTEGQTVTAMYQPAEDMGDNAFMRSGPDMDEKMHAFAY